MLERPPAIRNVATIELQHENGRGAFGTVMALVVDRDAEACRTAVRLLTEQDMDASGASTLADARTLVAAKHYDLVVVHHTLADGLDRLQPDTATIVVGGGPPAEGADDQLPEPFSAEQLSVSATRALRRRLERATGGESSNEPEDNRLAEGVLDCLTRAGRFRDEETAEHVERVSRTCALIGGELGLPTDECGALRAASAMHDIGKIGVPEGVLRKSEKLTTEERSLIERHAETGYQIMSGSSDPVLDLAATIARTHHERPDGKGYPQGLAADEIPLAGRITAVADAFDSLTHKRSYRPALTEDAAIEVMREGDGTMFDSGVLAAFQVVLPQIDRVRALYPDPPATWAEPASADAEAGDRPLRVLVVEDHSAVAHGLVLLMRREGMEIAGMAGTLGEAERLIAQRDADVVVLDADLQGDSTLGLIPAARARGTRVLLYTGRATHAPGRAEEAPDGFASKVGSPAELLAAIRDVAAGGAPSDSRVQAPAPTPPSEPLLTPREREITALLALGHNGEEIAIELFLSKHTVRTHIRNAMTRAEAKTRAHLIALAVESGEITLGAPSAA